MKRKNTTLGNTGLLRHTAFLLTLLAVLAGFLPLSAGAQTTCVPVASGVPALPGPPVWWDADADNSFPEIPQEDNRLTDPRWRGNAAITYPGVGATGDEVVFRGLQRTSGADTHIYLSWWVKVAPSFDDLSANRVLVGFSPGGSADDVLIEIQLATASPSTAAPQPAYAPTVWTKASGVTDWGTPLGAVPSWLTDFARVWVTPGTPHQWAVQMRVPVTSSSDVDDGVRIDPPSSDFRMWYEVRVDQIGATNDTGVVLYNWPRMVGTTMDGFDVVYPATGSWQPSRLASGPNDPGCGTDCVSIARLDVGTDNPVAHQIDLNGPNTFYALPTNNSGSNIPAGAIQADFRIANWGSLPDWNSVADPTSLWELIPDDADGGTTPNGQDVPSTGVINDGTQANAGNRIETTWTLTAAQRTPFTNGTKRTHQCMLVELEGPGLRFCPQSVYRNMDFVEASRFERAAEVSVRGLTAAPALGPRRDVYLYVETLNMPEKVPGGGGDDFDNFSGNFNRDPGGSATLPPDRLRQLPADRLDGFMPTYRVHAYHDTGERLRVDGEDCKVLRPQGSFGYYVSHEGELQGWRHSLSGPSLQELAPNFYRIPVPEGGAVTVETVIEAVETGRWSLSLHAGFNDPQGDFAELFDGGLAAGVDLEYLLTDLWALELFLGYDRFDGPGGFDPDLYHLSLNAKRYFPIGGANRWFVGAGVGRYDFDPGSTEDGFNLFTGAQLNVAPRWAVEATAKYHSVSSGDLEFLEVLGGFRFRF